MRRKTLDLDAHPESVSPKKHRPTWPGQNAPASCRFGMNNCHDNVSTIRLHTLEQSVKLLKALFTRQRLDSSRSSSKVVLNTSPAVIQTMGIRRSCFDQFIQLKTSCCSGDTGLSPSASSGCSEIHQSFTLHFCFASDSQHNGEKQGLGN